MLDKTFELRPLSAILIRSSSIVGKMNPYVNARLGLRYWKTQLSKGQDRKPIWTDLWQTTLEDEKSLFIEVRSPGILGDFRVGSALIDLSDVFTFGAVIREVPLNHNGSPAGKILLDMRIFERSTEDILLQHNINTSQSNLSHKVNINTFL